MTPDRICELLRDVQTLEVMRYHLATVDCRDETRDGWRLVLEAVDDRIALVNGALSFVDADLLRACELRLAQEQQMAEEECSTAMEHSPTTTESLRRLTIH